MHSAAATLLLMMGLIAPFSCDIALPINEDVYELPNVYIGPNGEVVVRPDRPKNFISADELKVYLENLRSYYAMMGRPRFGKRGPLIAFQRHSVAAEKTRKVHQMEFPEDDYGDPMAAPLPFRSFARGARGDRNQA